MSAPPSYEMSTLGASKASLQTDGLSTTAHFDVIAQVTRVWW